MRIFSTLFAALIFNVITFGQTNYNQYFTKNKTSSLHYLTIDELIKQTANHPSPITSGEAYNLRSNAYRLDSLIGYKYDTVLNSWLNKFGSQLSFYPNGALKSIIKFSSVGREIFSYNIDGYTTNHETYNYSSSNWVKTGKFEYVYDSSNNLTEAYLYNVANNQWVNYWMQQMTYNSNNNQITYKSSYWVNNTWENDVKSEVSYINGVVDTIFIFNANFQYWIPLSKIGFSYNSQGLETLSKNYQYDGNVWSLTYRTTNSYTSNNKISETVSTHFDGVQWLNTNKVIYNYNSDTLLIQKTEYSGDSTAWGKFQKTDNIYDNSSNLLKRTVQIGYNNTWINNIEGRLSYNSSNQIETRSYHNWNDTITSWVNQFKTQSIYDGSGNIIQFIQYKGDNQNWNNQNKKEIQFNQSIPLSDITPVSFWDAYLNYINQPLVEKNYVADGNNNFVLIDSITYFYSGPITGVTDNDISKIQVYPNPTSDWVIIKGDFSIPTLVSLFDVTGRIVKSTVINGNSSLVNLQNLNAGLYYLKIKIGDKQFSKKIIKQL